MQSALWASPYRPGGILWRLRSMLLGSVSDRSRSPGAPIGRYVARLVCNSDRTASMRLFRNPVSCRSPELGSCGCWRERIRDSPDVNRACPRNSLQATSHAAKATLRIWDWDTGNPSVGTLVRVASAFRVEVSTLLETADKQRRWSHRYPKETGKLDRTHVSGYR